MLGHAILEQVTARDEEFSESEITLGPARKRIQAGQAVA